MGWRIELSDSALRDLQRLGRPDARRVLDFLREWVAPLDDPRQRGKALAGPLGEFWCYRVGDMRLICDIEDSILRVLVLQAGRRGEVYRRR